MDSDSGIDEAFHNGEWGHHGPTADVGTRSMTQAEAAIVAALVALIGVIGARLLQERSERRAAAIHELRDRTAAAFREAFVVQHAIEWLTWHARHDPSSLWGAMKSDYDETVHQAFPALLGAMAGAAALSMDVYDGLQPVFYRLYTLDEKVALETRFLHGDAEARDAAIERLSKLYDESLVLLKVLPDQISQVMAIADPAARNV